MKLAQSGCYLAQSVNLLATQFFTLKPFIEYIAVHAEDGLPQADRHLAHLLPHRSLHHFHHSDRLGIAEGKTRQKPQRCVATRDLVNVWMRLRCGVFVEEQWLTCLNLMLWKQIRYHSDIQMPTKAWTALPYNHNSKQLSSVDSGYGSVGRAVTSDSWGPRFESSHWQKIVMITYCIEKTKIKEKRQRMVHLKNVFNISGWVQNEDDQRQVKSVKLVQFVVVGLTLVLITFYWTYALIVYFDVRPW